MTTSFFADVPVASPDVILGVTEAFRKDSDPRKVNLGVGIYQDGNGKIPVLKVIRHAAKQWFEAEENKSYLPIDGIASYNSATQELLFGKGAQAIAENRIVTIQSVGGSGALKLGADLIRRFLPDAAIYISDPSWENHRALFEGAGIKIATYPYYDATTHGLRRAEMLESLRNIPKRNAILLHACCHNPTGVDLDINTWKEVIDICAERELLPFIDFAYQGFAEGPEQDAAAIRMFADKGLSFLVANSYAKSFSMYRERCGALSIVTASSQEATAVLSQLKKIVRSLYSSPPSYGAQLISIVLNSPELKKMWEEELGEMCARIHSMRHLFCSKLAAAISDHDFSFILQQRGMFSYSGLSAEMVRSLRERYHIYAIESGRICVAAINEGNVDYICEAISGVLRAP